MNNRSFASMHPGRSKLISAYHDDDNTYGVGKNRLLTPGRLSLDKNNYWTKSKDVFSGHLSGKLNDNRHVSVDGSTLVGDHGLKSLTDRLNAKVTKFKKGN